MAAIIFDRAGLASSFFVAASSNSAAKDTNNETSPSTLKHSIALEWLTHMLRLGIKAVDLSGKKARD